MKCKRGGGLDEGVSGGAGAREVVMLTACDSSCTCVCLHNDGTGAVFPQTADAHISLPQKETISCNYCPPLFVTVSASPEHAHSAPTFYSVRKMF